MQLLLPVILFVLTLAIIFLLRAGDKKEKSFSRVMDMISKFRSEADKTGAQLKETSQQASNEISVQVASVRQLMHSIDDKISDLQDRSDDLSKLQAVMNNYRDVLMQLSETTTQAEQKIQRVKEEVSEVQRVEGLIATFQQQIEETKQTIQTNLAASEETVASMETKTLKNLDTYKEEVTKTLQASHDSIDEMARTLQSEEATAVATVRNANEELRQLGAQTSSLFEEDKKQFNELQASSVTQVNKDLAAFTAACTEKLETVFKQTIEQIDASFLTMVHTSQVFINELDNRLATTREITSALEAKSSENLADAAKKFDEYSRQITANRTMTSSQENHKKQMDESLKAVQEETSALHEELERLKTQKAAIIQQMERRECSAIIPQEMKKEQGPEEPQVEDLITRNTDGRRPSETEEAEPLPVQEFEKAFVAEDKQPEPEEHPDLSMLESQEKPKGKQEKAVSYIPVGKEEEIHLDDES